MTIEVFKPLSEESYLAFTQGITRRQARLRIQKKLKEEGHKPLSGGFDGAAVLRHQRTMRLKRAATKRRMKLKAHKRKLVRAARRVNRP